MKDVRYASKFLLFFFTKNYEHPEKNLLVLSGKHMKISTRKYERTCVIFEPCTLEDTGKHMLEQTTKVMIGREKRSRVMIV